MGSDGGNKDRLIQALRVEIKRLQTSLVELEASLHDGPMQRVIAAHMQLQAMNSDGELTEQHLQELEVVDQMLITAIEQTRKIITGGGGEEIALEGIGDLEKICLELASESFAVRLSASDHWDRISPELQVPVLLLVREAVWNSKKHSGADAVVVRLHNKAQRVEISIEDRGCGFVVEQVDVDKFGLCTMLQRAKNHGIELRIESTPKLGTRIEIEC
jgi:signal transduction histidine kinase